MFVCRYHYYCCYQFIFAVTILSSVTRLVTGCPANRFIHKPVYQKCEICTEQYRHLNSCCICSVPLCAVCQYSNVSIMSVERLLGHPGYNTPQQKLGNYVYHLTSKVNNPAIHRFPAHWHSRELNGKWPTQRCFSQYLCQQLGQPAGGRAVPQRTASEGTQQGPATWQSYTTLLQNLTVSQLHRSNEKKSQGPTPPRFPAARQVAPCLRQSEVRSQLSPCGTSGGHRFSPVLLFSPVSITPPVLQTQPLTLCNHSSLQRR